MKFFPNSYSEKLLIEDYPKFLTGLKKISYDKPHGFKKAPVFFDLVAIKSDYCFDLYQIGRYSKHQIFGRLFEPVIKVNYNPSDRVLMLKVESNNFSAIMTFIMAAFLSIPTLFTENNWMFPLLFLVFAVLYYAMGWGTYSMKFATARNSIRFLRQIEGVKKQHIT